MEHIKQNTVEESTETSKNLLYKEVVSFTQRLSYQTNKTMKKICTFCIISVMLVIQAHAQQAPGGVKGSIRLWLKGGAGTSSTTDGAALSSWNDQGGLANNMSQATTSNQPYYTASFLNGNPAVRFQGGRYFSDVNGIMGTSGTAGANVFIVHRNSSTSTGYIFSESLSGGASAKFQAQIPLSTDSKVYWDAGNTSTSTNRLSGAWGGTTGTPYIWGLFMSTSAATFGSGTRQAIQRNGATIFSDGTANSFTGNNSTFNLGQSTSDEYVAEMVVYNRDLTLVESQRIQSYLAS